MNIQRLPANASKLTELEALKKICSYFADGTYLSGFFTPRLFAWIKNQIDVDFSCDIMSSLDYYQDQLNAALKETNETRAMLEAERRAHQRDRAQWENDRVALTEANENLDSCLQSCKEQRNALEDRLYDVTRNEQRLSQELYDMDRAHTEEINALKALLFDLQNKTAPTEARTPAAFE